MKILTSIFALATLAACSTAFARSKGDWMWRLGAPSVRPDVTSGNLSAPSLPNTQTDVRPDTQVGGGISYMLTDSISIDVPLAMPFEHEVVGAGAIAGVGVLGKNSVLPVSVFAQYRFLSPQSSIRPYIGAGLTYAHFHDEEGTAVLTAITNPGGTATTMRTKDKLGVGLQLGASYKINDKWFVEGSYYKTFLKTTSTLSTGQSIETKFNPNTFTLGIGMRF